MTSAISTTLRAGLQVAVGSTLILAPFPLGLGVPAAAAGVAIGALAIALALAGTAPEGRGTLPLSAQAVYDRGLALGLLVSGVIFGLAGQTPALVFFGALGLVALVAALTTRYVARPV